MREQKLLVLLAVFFSCQTAVGYVLPVSSISRPSDKTMIGCSSPPLAFSKPISSFIHHKTMLPFRSADSNDNHKSLRDRLRQVTGFSFTALRTTLRGITGISLTAIYASAVATTSSFVRTTMKIILSIFPSWVRAWD